MEGCSLEFIAMLVLGLLAWLIGLSVSLSEHAARIKALDDELSRLRRQLATGDVLPEPSRAQEPRREPAVESTSERQPSLPPVNTESVFDTLRRPRTKPEPIVASEPVAPAAPTVTGPKRDVTPRPTVAPRTAATRPKVARRSPEPSVSWEQAWHIVAGPLGGRRDSGDGAAEVRVGTVWLSRIGIILLLIGAVFAYRYGVTTNALRAVIGYVAGLSLLALGYWGNRRGFRIWAQAITGGGIGLLYLTTAAGSAYFVPPVIPRAVGFALMILTTGLGTGLAILYNAQVLGLLSLIGGFATPFLLSTGQGGNLPLLFAYIAVLDAGLLLVAALRKWPVYNYLVFGATWGVLGLWRLFAFTPADRGWALGFASVYFVIFNLVSLAQSLVRRRRSGPANLALTTLNALIYFGAGLMLVDTGYTVIRGFFAFAVAAVYAGLSLALLRRNRDDRLMVLACLGLAALFLTIAFPVALNGSWLTAAWAIEGALLVWLGLSADLPVVLNAGQIVLALAAGRLAVWDTFPQQFGRPLLMPGLRAFTFLVTIASFYAAALACWRRRRADLTRVACAVAGSVFTLWYLTFEVILHYEGLPLAPVQLASDCGLTLAAVWALYGLVVAFCDRRFRSVAVRVGTRLVLGAALAATVVSELYGEPSQLLACGGLAVTLASIWAAEFDFRRRGVDGDTNGCLSLIANAVGFVAVAMQVNRIMEARLAPTLGEIVTDYLWRVGTRGYATLTVMAVYALLATLVGVILRSRPARTAGGVFALISITGGAVAAVRWPGADLALRLAAFVALVPGTYVAVWAARRSFGGQSRLEAHTLGAAGLAATVLTAWWGAWVIRQHVTMLYAYYPEVVWLGLYALAVGLVGRRLRAPAVRWLARILQLPALLLLLGSAGWQVSLAWLVPAAVIAVAGIYLADWLFAAENRSRLEAGFSRAAKLAACLANLAWGGLLINTSLPVLNQQPLPLQLVTLSTRNHLIVSFVGLYGLAALILGLRIKLPDARRLGLGLQAAALLGLVGVAVQNSAAPLWLRGGSYLVCIGSLYALRRLAGSVTPPVSESERLAATTLPLVGTGLTVVWLAFQVSEYFRPFYIDATASERLLTASTQSFSISAAWGLYGLLVLIIGFTRRHRWTRLIGLGTLALTLIKIGAYDMWKLAVQSRIWITVGLGIIFVAASLLYTRYRRLILTDTPKEEIGA